MTDERRARVDALIREVPDFPKPGILFKDITPVLSDPTGLADAIGLMREAVRDLEFDTVAGIESRGFLFGVTLAAEVGVGFVPVRKPGRLPAATHRVDYELEYGSDALEIHQDALKSGPRVLIVDDLLATGGTAAATKRLVEKAGGEVIGAVFLIELAFLGGSEALAGLPVRSVLQYD